VQLQQFGELLDQLTSASQGEEVVRRGEAEAAATDEPIAGGCL
jgi:hypothetical protein